jgi:methionine synthase II (cobalamin-independent)
LRFDNLGYADWALESYETFSRLKAEGVIPPAVRFQVDLPSPGVVAAMLAVPEQFKAIQSAYRAGLFAEIQRMLETVPAEELAIQWDCTEPGDWTGFPSPLQELGLDGLAGYAEGVPPGVEIGYHLCYGDFEHKHGAEPDSLGGAVEIANGIYARVERRIDWVHFAVPRDRDDAAYFAPLSNLEARPETRVALGLVHYTDGLEGARRRMEAARKVLPDFAVATECGFGRRPPETIRDLMRMHVEAAAWLRS